MIREQILEMAKEWYQICPGGGPLSNVLTDGYKGQVAIQWSIAELIKADGLSEEIRQKGYILGLELAQLPIIDMDWLLERYHEYAFPDEVLGIKR